MAGEGRMSMTCMIDRTRFAKRSSQRDVEGVQDAEGHKFKWNRNYDFTLNASCL